MFGICLLLSKEVEEDEAQCVGFSQVVGGADKGGILVRKGQDLKSDQLADRPLAAIERLCLPRVVQSPGLSTGALVSLMFTSFHPAFLLDSLEGSRLNFRSCLSLVPKPFTSTAIFGQPSLICSFSAHDILP